MDDKEYAILIFRKAFELDENIDVKPVNEALDMLPGFEQLMLDCLYRRGMTDEKTAKLMGVRVSSVCILRDSALQRLRDALKNMTKYGYWV